MKKLSRRDFLVRIAGAVAASAVVPYTLGAGVSGSRIRVGTCRMGLLQARQAGFEGVEVTAGNPADKLDISKDEVRNLYKAQMQQTGLPISSIMMGLFNNCPLATDPRASAWIEQTIDAAKDLKAKNILLAFFVQGDLLVDMQLKEAEFKSAAQKIKALAPVAQAAGVTLSIESYLNAEQNLRMLEMIGEDSVRIYYDVYNTGKSKKYDSPAEIRQLKGRISQVHYKNGAQYLDEDQPYFAAVSTALKEINYQGWITLETSSPSKNLIEDARRDATFVRSLFA